jgi:hypothetical protein
MTMANIDYETPEQIRARMGAGITPGMRGAFFCTKCGHVGNAKKIVKGSFIMEVCLWVLIFPLGACYSVWRIITKFNGCEKCGGDGLIPSDSPMAKKMMA